MKRLYVSNVVISFLLSIIVKCSSSFLLQNQNSWQHQSSFSRSAESPTTTEGSINLKDVSTTSTDIDSTIGYPIELNNGAFDQIQLSQDDDAFGLLAGRAAVCLLESDMRRDAIGKPGGSQASSATNWINDKSAFALQQALDRVDLKLPEDRTGVDRDECATWLRWMKSAPTSLLVDLSLDFRKLANETLTLADVDRLEILSSSSSSSATSISQSRDDFLSRLGCRLILLPSGSALSQPLQEPIASLIYGKLLYGGATRYRLLSSSGSKRPPRRAGERTETRATPKDLVPGWIMYGGTERMYEAVDMGAAAVLEIWLLQGGSTSVASASSSDQQEKNRDMSLHRMPWKPQLMFDFVADDVANQNGALVDDEVNGFMPSALSGKARNQAFQDDFTSSVGGLQPQIDAIVRRVLDGRVIRPAEVVTPVNGEGTDKSAFEDGVDETTRELAMAAVEAEELQLLGLTPVRGLLLYGPPGCGKTQLAREISRALKAREPKIVSAPELLDRWVGGSEKLVRALFADAEAELAACQGDATRSALHVIVIDEIDAVFRRRSSGEDSGEATRASAVNQILAKLDGVKAIPNILLIGMTNRRELLDEALLRPGRLEVQIEIPLPNKEGRREILQIHFDTLRKRGRLSKPLCCAIDGVRGYLSDEDWERFDDDDDAITKSNSVVPNGISGSESSAKNGKNEGKLRTRRRRSRLATAVERLLPEAVKPIYDLAGTPTTGFSGADIAGLVRCAGSIALSRARKDGSGVEGLLITLEDVKQALKEVKR